MGFARGQTKIIFRFLLFSPLYICIREYVPFILRVRKLGGRIIVFRIGAAGRKRLRHPIAACELAPSCTREGLSPRAAAGRRPILRLVPQAARRPVAVRHRRATTSRGDEIASNLRGRAGQSLVKGSLSSRRRAGDSGRGQELLSHLPARVPISVPAVVWLTAGLRRAIKNRGHRPKFGHQAQLVH
jgi:hypothetical protein